MDYRKIASEFDYEICFLEPSEFDEAIVGFQERFGQDPILLYSKKKVLDIIRRDMEGDEEEVDTMALEYYYYNTLGAYMGKGTPSFLCDDGEFE